MYYDDFIFNNKTDKIEICYFNLNYFEKLNLQDKLVIIIDFRSNLKDKNKLLSCIHQIKFVDIHNYELEFFQILNKNKSLKVIINSIILNQNIHSNDASNEMIKYFKGYNNTLISIKIYTFKEILDPTIEFIKEIVYLNNLSLSKLNITTSLLTKANKEFFNNLNLQLLESNNNQTKLNVIKLDFEEKDKYNDYDFNFKGIGNLLNSFLITSIKEICNSNLDSEFKQLNYLLLKINNIEILNYIFNNNITALKPFKNVSILSIILKMLNNY